MTIFSFNYQGTPYELSEQNCSGLFIEEDYDIQGLELTTILELLKNSDQVAFLPDYLDGPCQKCRQNTVEASKNFKYLEYHFYVFTKNNQFVMSSISEAYQNTTLPQLLKQGLVDESFMLSISLCPVCSDYSIDLEYCDF